jgi:hypothetical protein
MLQVSKFRYRTSQGLVPDGIARYTRVEDTPSASAVGFNPRIAAALDTNQK